jgi:hypothetical protein
MLEIVDWLPFLFVVPRKRKIDLLIGVRRSVDRILESRQ